MLGIIHSNEELGEQIAELAAQLAAGTARFLALIGEFDAREGWGEYGIKSCAHWLSWRCGLSPVAAREQLRVARALRRLPAIGRAFSRGELSYSKVRALSRIATVENESLLLEWGRHGTAAQLEHLVRGFRRARANGDPMQMHARRSVQWYWDDDGSLVLRARLAPEDGAMLVRAIEDAEKSLDVSAETHPSAQASDIAAEASLRDDASPPSEARRADALVAVAERSLRANCSPADLERTLVVLNVDQAALSGIAPTLRPGGAVTEETARRLACDAGLIRTTDGGSTTIGRRSRVVPRRMRRALHRRDRACRFPSCTSTRVDAHHVRHWAKGGETRLDNLLLLCRYHHRLVHEGGYRVEVAGSDARFYRSDGRSIEPRAVVVENEDAALRHANRAAGLRFAPDTIASWWNGRPPDYSIAVEGLLTLEARGVP